MHVGRPHVLQLRVVERLVGPLHVAVMPVQQLYQVQTPAQQKPRQSRPAVRMRVQLTYVQSMPAQRMHAPQMPVLSM